MTREEEILNAARTRAERHQIAEMELYGGDKCNYSYGRIYFSEIASFEAGAKWADQHPNNVWHDANDNPTEDTLILYRTTSGKYEVTELVCTSEGVWHLFVKEYEVAEWAYISDLLPKGGEL